MKLVVTATLSFTYSPTGSAFTIVFLYFSISGAIFSGLPPVKQITPRPICAARSNVSGLPAATHNGGCGFTYGFGNTLRSGIAKYLPSKLYGSSRHIFTISRIASSYMSLVSSGSVIPKPPISVVD